MQFWQGPIVDALVVLAVLGGTGLIWRSIPGLSRLGLPASMAAGLILLGLGPSLGGVLPYEVSTLETIVYHGLALVFVAFGLIPPAPGATMSKDARAMMLAIPAIAVIQGIVGMAVVLLFTGLGDPLHPGFGQALPLAFSQGPGQALSLGRTWESAGMAHGGQVGLSMAAIGYLWCVLVGAPLLWSARRLGWTTVDPAPAAAVSDDEVSLPPRAGELDPLTLHVALVALVYLGVFILLTALSGVVTAERPRAMIWGFHFLFGMFTAIGTRRLLTAAGVALDRATLRRIGGLTVDVVTCAAFGAVQLAVLEAYAVPIFTICILGGSTTLLACIWLARRAFREDPFAHALALFGLATGTLPTGLALLRAHDPELKGPAARNVVLGATGAIVPGIPLLLVIVPMPIVGWPESFPTAVWQTVFAQLAYLGLLVGLWWRFAGLRGLTRARLWWTED